MDVRVESMRIVGLCEPCCAFTRARERWEETCVGRVACENCPATAPDYRYPFAVFRVPVEDDYQRPPEEGEPLDPAAIVSQSSQRVMTAYNTSRIAPAANSAEA